MWFALDVCLAIKLILRLCMVTRAMFKDMTCGQQGFMMHLALAMFVGCLYRSGLMTSLSARIGPN